jgi:hypothetical protein
MNNRTTGIIVTVIAVLLFGCPGLICLCSGFSSTIVGLSGDPYYYLGIDTEPSYALIVGLSIICLSVILIAIPIVVGVFTIRGRQPSEADDAITIDAQAYDPVESEAQAAQDEPEEPEDEIPPAI